MARLVRAVNRFFHRDKRACSGVEFCAFGLYSETASVSDARLSRIGRLGHDGPPGGVGLFSERDARNACGASCYGRAETALEGGSRDEAGAGK